MKLIERRIKIPMIIMKIKIMLKQEKKVIKKKRMRHPLKLNKMKKIKKKKKKNRIIYKMIMIIKIKYLILKNK